MPAVIQKSVLGGLVSPAVMSWDLLAPFVIGRSDIFFIFSHLLLALAAITGVLPHAGRNESNNNGNSRSGVASISLSVITLFYRFSLSV